MKYIALSFTLTPMSADARDILTAWLSPLPYDAFTDSPQGLIAYCPEPQFSAKALQEQLRTFPLNEVSVTYEVSSLPDRNWNETWETHSFHPIVIDRRCAIYSPDHPNPPRAEYNLLIRPRNAFGTGYHSTTSLMIRTLMQLPLEGKHVIDAGCGTAILSILAAKLGAAHITAFDIDPWSIDNARSNLALNEVTQVTLRLGSATTLTDMRPADVLLANINKNTLIDAMPHFAAWVKPKGTLLLSGFFETDIEALTHAATPHALRLQSSRVDDGWALMVLQKVA